MAFEISRSHHMDKAASRRRVEEVVASLGQTYHFSYHWDGDRLRFGNLAVKGYVEIADHQVRVFVRKSPLLPVSEDSIRSEVEATMEQYLSKGEW
ncbi:MAG: polyhydroxyalkanoic acid system family protein [Rhodothermales bacterium]